MDFHVQYILSQCAQRMYLIKLLQQKGMPQRQLSVVSYSIVAPCIVYALPAWVGFLSAELIGRIKVFFRRVKWFGYIDTVLTVDVLLSQSGYDLFVKTSIPGHSLHHLLPTYRSSNLREHGYSSTCLIMTLSCLKSRLLCAIYTNLLHRTTNLFYLCYFVYSLCVMRCVCRILIKITYLLMSALGKILHCCTALTLFFCNNM